jgi:hypothetical protein
MRQVPCPAPGETLRTGFLELLASPNADGRAPLACRRCGSGRSSPARAIRVDTGLRLSRYLGLNDGFWVGLQLDYDVAVAKDRLAAELDRITPHELETAY